MEIGKLVDDAINSTLSDAGIDTKLSDDLKLLGSEGVLDSIDLVNLLSELEEQVEDKLGKEITILNEKAFSSKNSPFSTVGVLKEYLQSLMN